MKKRAASLLLSCLLALTIGASAAASSPFAPQPSRSVLVTVLGHNGRPLANTNVHLMVPGQSALSADRTNAAGQVRLDLPPGYSYWIRAYPEGHNVIERSYVPAADGSVLTLQTEAYTAQAFGLVTDEKGRPAAGATVTIWRDGAGLAGTTQTNSTGVYRFHSLPASGTYTVQVEARTFAPLVQSNLTFAAGARTQLDLQLSPAAGTITGEIVNAATGAAVPGARVELILSDYGLVETVSTDRFGAFRLVAPGAAGTYRLRLWHNNYETQDVAVNLSQGSWLDLSGQNRISLNPLYGQVSGSVVGANGTARAGALVELQQLGLGTVASATTNDEGFFDFRNVPAGTYRVRNASDTGHPGASDWVAVNGGSRVTAVVDARTPNLSSYGNSAIVGTVLDHRGEPVSGATVTAYRGNQPVSTTTDSAGRYRLPVAITVEDKISDPATADGYRIAVTKSGYLPTDQQNPGGTPPPAIIDVRPRQSTQADFTLYPDRGELGGRVLDDRGEPVAGVSIALHKEGSGQIAQVSTDEFGRYLFSSQPVAGQVRYLVAVSDANYTAGATAPSGAPLDLVSLEPGAILQQTLTVRPVSNLLYGFVSAGDDQPADNATVTITRAADGKAWTVQTDEDGYYALNLQPRPGDQFFLRASKAGAASGTLQNPISFSTSEYAVVANLEVIPQAQVTGRVVSPTGQPVGGSTVALFAEGTNRILSLVTTNSDGTYEITGLDPGRRYSVAVWHNAYTWSALAPGEPVLTPLFTPAPGETVWSDLLVQPGR